jgi:hypothetical protein
VVQPTGAPSTYTKAMDSAAPMRSTVRRPCHSAGISTTRRYTAVGLSPGTDGGSPAKGMATLV